MVSDALSWEQAEEKKAQITALLKQWQRDEKLPYRLSMSIGYYQKEPDTGLPWNSILTGQMSECMR